jgi:hypothetical protein
MQTTPKNLNYLPHLVNSPLVRIPSSDFRWLNDHDIMLPYLVWAGMQAVSNQECPFHESIGKRSFWVARNSLSSGREYRFKCLADGCLGGDVAQLHYELVLRYGHPFPEWSLKYACGDLLHRIREGEISLSAGKQQPLLAHNNSYSHRIEWIEEEARFYQQLSTNKPSVRRGVVASRLPDPLPKVTAFKVIKGLYVERDNSIMLKKQPNHTCAIHTVKEWLERYSRWKVDKMGYTVQTYLESSKKEGFSPYRRYAVIESDRLSLGEQMTVLLELARRHYLKCVCFSGNRSLHGWFPVAGKSVEEVYLLYREAMDIGGRIDTSLFKREHLVRLPGGWNWTQKRRQDVLLWKG